MSTITITAGGKAGSYRGDPGAYAATLVTHTIEGPFSAKQPKFAGETYKLHEWGFAIEGAPDDGCMVWIASSESTGPQSKTFGILSALFGGKEPPVGTTLDIETHLIGRMALVDVRENDRGYLDVVGVTPLPRAMQKGAPAKAAPRRAPATVPPATDDIDASLPF